MASRRSGVRIPLPPPECDEAGRPTRRLAFSLPNGRLAHPGAQGRAWACSHHKPVAPRVVCLPVRLAPGVPTSPQGPAARAVGRCFVIRMRNGASIITPLVRAGRTGPASLDSRQRAHSPRPDRPPIPGRNTGYGPIPLLFFILWLAPRSVAGAGAAAGRTRRTRAGRRARRPGATPVAHRRLDMPRTPRAGFASCAGDFASCVTRLRPRASPWQAGPWSRPRRGQVRAKTGAKGATSPPLPPEKSQKVCRLGINRFSNRVISCPLYQNLAPAVDRREGSGLGWRRGTCMEVRR